MVNHDSDHMIQTMMSAGVALKLQTRSAHQAKRPRPTYVPTKDRLVQKALSPPR